MCGEPRNGAFANDSPEVYRLMDILTPKQHSFYAAVIL